MLISGLVLVHARRLLRSRVHPQQSPRISLRIHHLQPHSEVARPYGALPAASAERYAAAFYVHCIRAAPINLDVDNPTIRGLALYRGLFL